MKWSGKRLASHGSFGSIVERYHIGLKNGLGNVWYAANSMHICFYEGWCTKGHVEEALSIAKKFIDTIENTIASR